MKSLKLKRNILKIGAIVLIVTSMILPTAVVSVNPEQNELSNAFISLKYKTLQTQKNMKNIINNKLVHHTIVGNGDWIYYHNGYDNNAIGLTGGGTFQGAIRLTSDEFQPDYCNCQLTTVRFYHNVYEGTSETHSGNIKIYAEGTPTQPGSLITSEPYTVTGDGWFEVSLTNPVLINCNNDLWASVEVTHEAGEYPLGIDAGPAVDGKGDWMEYGSGWIEMQDYGYDVNWCIEVKVECGPSSLISFYQLDCDFDGDVIVDSTYGEAEITLMELFDGVMYTNLVVNGIWVVQNLPIVPVDYDFVLSFDLGVENGQEVQQIYYAYSITPYIIQTMPTDFSLISVLDGLAVLYSGYLDGTIVFAPPNIVVADRVDYFAFRKGKIINQDCKRDECVPAAVSNSLKYLNDEYDMGWTDAQTSIEEMKKATSWNNGCEHTWCNDKKEKLKNMVTTDIVWSPPPPDKYKMIYIMAELSRGQDIEMSSPTHCAQVTGILAINNGLYVIHIAHDEAQGVDGEGTINEPLVYDPITNKFTGGNGFNGKSLNKFVIECPKNRPPNKPDKPKKQGGMENPRLPDEYTFCSKTIDPDGDQVWYWWDWGDGTNSGWLGPENSGDEACASHSWLPGTYQIKVKAKDTHDAESEWSDPFTLTLSRNKAINGQFLNFLQSHPNLFPILRLLFQRLGLQ